MKHGTVEKLTAAQVASLARVYVILLRHDEQQRREGQGHATSVVRTSKRQETSG